MGSILAISGKQRTGKDTLAKMLLEKLSAFNFQIIGFADSLKEVVAKQHNITVDELNDLKNSDPCWRKVLIQTSKFYRATDELYWVKKLLNNKKGNLIIPDLRYRFELDYLIKRRESDCENELAERCEPILIRIEASPDVRAQRGTLSNETDASETELDSYPAWDYHLKNNSNIHSLACQVDRLVPHIRSQLLSASGYKALDFLA